MRKRLSAGSLVAAMAVFTQITIAASVIVDNKDAGFKVLSGSWSTGSSPTPYPPDGSGDYRWTSTVSGSPTAEVEWRPHLPSTGSYTVYVWYVAGPNRSPNAAYVVDHANGSTTVRVNQQENGGQWFSIGQFTFNAGTSGRVRLHNQDQQGRVVMADAVQFEEVVASYNLHMAVTPEGTGTTFPPVGGPYEYGPNEVVSISATAEPGYVFDHWTVSGGSDVASPTSAQTTVTMDQAKTVTAIFAPLYRDVTMAVRPIGGGTTTPVAGGPYETVRNQVLHISATPASGFVFDHWEVSNGSAVDQPASPSTTVTIDQSKTVTAVFRCQQPQLNVLVTPLDAGITTPAVGGPYAFSPGQTVDLSAIASPFFVFDHWAVTAGSEVANPTSASTTVTMDQSKTVIAVFRSTLPRDGEIRAFWAVAFQPGYKSQSEIDTMVQAAVDGNYNVIIAQMLAYQDTGSGAHGAYWNSSIVPKARDINPPEFDPLAYLCEKAHAHGIQVHVMSVPYRMCQVWPPPNNPFLESHPEWFSVSQADAGCIIPKPLSNNIIVLDPGNPEVQDYLLAIMREMLTNYPIDGVHWDLEYVATGYYPTDLNNPNSTLARFQRISGYTGIPDTSYGPWEDFRRRVNTEIIRRAHAEILSLCTPTRQMRQSASLIAYGGIEAKFTDSEAYKEFNDWEFWTRAGYLDTAIPMNYQREHNASQRQNFRDSIPQENIWKNNRELVPGLAHYLNYFEGSLAQIRYCREMNTDGIASYDYWYPTTDGTNAKADPTWYTSPTGVRSVFPTPVPVPTMRWRDPATATEGTLWGRVTDAATGLALDDVTVQIGALEPVQTDGNGYYVVAMANATSLGTDWTITISKSGYKSAVYTGVQSVAGQARQYDFTLEALPALSAVVLIASPPDGGQVTGAGLYENGTSVTVTATALPDYRFVNWTEDGVEVCKSESYTFTVAGDRSLVANFVAYPRTAKPEISPAGGAFKASAQVTISCATPGATITYTTDGSEPAADSTVYLEPLVFTVPTTLKARAFAAGCRPSEVATATFDVTPVYSLVAKASPLGSGTFRGEGVFLSGTKVMIKAIPNEGYAFVHWTRDEVPVSTQASYMFTITDNTILVAHFEPLDPCRVTTVASPAEAGSTSGGGKFPIGTSLTVKATANPGYVFVNWTEDGVPVSVSPDYRFKLNGDRTLVANFSAGQAAWGVTISPSGGIFSRPVEVTLLCGTPGATMTFTTDGSDPTDDSPVYTGPFVLSTSAVVKAKVRGVAGGSIATAEFTVAQSNASSFQLTIIEPNGQSIPHTYAGGQSYQITAPPAPAGQRFSFWSGDVSGTDNPITIFMDRDKTIVANYEDCPETPSVPCGAGVPACGLTALVLLGLMKVRPMGRVGGGVYSPRR